MKYPMRSGEEQGWLLGNSRAKETAVLRQSRGASRRHRTGHDLVLSTRAVAVVMWRRTRIKDVGERLVRALESNPATHAPGTRPGMRAAVLVPMFDAQEGVRVWLTTRSQRVSTHKGEVSLPGGRSEDGDDTPAGTALREAEEEVGLDSRSVVRIFGSLQEVPSKHGLGVIPVLGEVDSQWVGRRTSDEVEDVWSAPLSMFLDAKGHRSSVGRYAHFGDGAEFLVHYFDYDDGSGQTRVVWGLTAYVLIETAKLVYGRDPAFALYPNSRPGEEKEGGSRL